MPSKSLYKETGVKYDPSGGSNMTPQQRAEVLLGQKNVERRFGRVPLSDVVDLRLSDQAHRLLSLMSAVAYPGRKASLSRGEIAWALGTSESTAKRRVRELVKCGRVKIESTHNKRNVYVLQGDIFSAAAGVGAPEQKPNVDRPPFLHCARCHRGCLGLGREGWCRTCRGDVDEERRYWEAKRVIGDEATLEQIAAHLHLEKITKRLRRIARRCDPAA